MTPAEPRKERDSLGMTALLVAIGGAVGAVVGGLPGLLAGGAIGLLAGQQLDLRRRLTKVEEARTDVQEMRVWATDMKAWAEQTHAWLARLARSDRPAEASLDPAPVTQPAEDQPDPNREPQPAEASLDPAPVTQPAEDQPEQPEQPVRPGADRGKSREPISWLVHRVKQWVTTGNAPVKVGVLVSLVGVGLLLREAHRRGVIELTIEVRLAAAAVFGLVMLAVGWRQRHRRRVYGLSLQGGAIAVLYVTAYAAFAVYDVLPAVPAALAVVLITVGAGALSVVQDARSLAVLGIIGGFLAPVLTYSQPEDHVIVFAFFAVLNTAILAVAWFKTWPELNLLGFGFTFGLTAFWLTNRYEQDEWVSTQPFIALFVLMYLGLPVLVAVRDTPDFKGALAASRPSDALLARGVWTAPLVFSTPFLGLGLQQLAIGHTSYGVAASAAALAVIQGALALVSNRLGAERRQLAEAQAGLGLAFSAIAVPLALDSYFTATVWAAQGLVLVWLGCRRGRRLALGGGALLQVLAALSLTAHLGESLPYPDDALVILNEYFLGALALAVAGLASGWLLSRRPGRGNANQLLAWLGLVWGTVWWLIGGLMEIVQQLPAGGELSASLGFMVGSFAVGSLAARPLRWPQLNAWGLLILPTLVVMLAVSLLAQAHPLDRWGWAAWPPVFAVHYLLLRREENRREHAFPHVAYVATSDAAASDAAARVVVALLHAGGYWALAVLAAREVYWQVDQVAEGVWPLAAASAAVLTLAGATMAGRRWLRWPVAAHWRTYLLACSGPLLIVLAVAVLYIAVLSDGDPSPLLYLPVLNPLGVLVAMQLAALLAWRKLAGAERDHPFRDLVDARWSPGLGVLGLILATAETARTVSHWLDVPWDLESLWDSTALQTSLSILWAVIALSLMVAGVRMARRAVWVAGASWMAAVVVKLFLVDLRNLSAAGRVVSFIAVGFLLLIVGYLAPAPPATLSEADDQESADD